MPTDMKIETFDNVWDALEDTPKDAARMTMLSDLMLANDRRLRIWNVSPVQAAKRLGITPARLDELLKGKIDRFDLDDLLTIAVRAGLRISLDIRDAA